VTVAVAESDALTRSRDQILRWRAGGPALFAVEALGVPREWDAKTKRGVLPWQWKASEKLVAKRRLSIRAGKGVGKSAFLAWTILWFHTCYFPAKAGCTAPTATQMSDVLWAELSLWHRALRDRYPSLGEKFEWKVDAFVMKEAPQESFAVARTARPEKPEALQGLHSKHVLVIVDEASGVDDAIFDAGRGAMAGENCFVVLASNCTRLGGLFYKTHHELAPLWETLHVNGEDVPLQTQQFRDEIIYEYGRDSNYYRVNVMGDFPTAEDDVVIPKPLCEAALKRDVKAYGTRVWGVDIARFGSDRCVLVKRCDNATLEPHKSWSGMDTMKSAGLVFKEWQDTSPNERPVSIIVDVIGIGAGVVDRLMELDLPVIGLNVAESASVEDLYMRSRDELWFRARQWLEKRHSKLVEDKVLIAELSIPTYTFTSTGKILVESKDQMRKRYPRSPDVADAFCLTFADAAYHRGPQNLNPELFLDS
jgi:hypothetical protein